LRLLKITKIPSIWFRRFQIALCVLLVAGVVWSMLSAQVEVVLARNLLLYRAESVWRVAANPGGGQLRGRVLSSDGAPLSGASVLAAGPDGQTFTAESDASGAYTLSLPGGSFVPLATSAGYDDATLRAGPFRRTLMVVPGTTTQADFVLSRTVPRVQSADRSIQFGDEAIVHSDIAPAGGGLPFDVRRRGFTFGRAGALLGGSYVYEPNAGGAYPALLFIYPCWLYPCSTIGWDLLSTTMAAQGFVVVTFAPQRGADLEADMDDVLALIAHIKAGQLSALADTSRLTLLGGSLTSLHVWRVAQLAPPGALRGIVVLGGISDLFLIRQRFESHLLLLEPPFDVPLSTALIGLGRPNLNPELYARYSPVYHLDALPRVPLALIHGGGDKTVPFEQSPHFAERLRAHSIAHELYLYPNQEHYLDLENINDDERDMLAKVVGFLQAALR